MRILGAQWEMHMMSCELHIERSIYPSVYLSYLSNLIKSNLILYLYVHM